MRYANTLSVCQLAGLPAPLRTFGGVEGQAVATVRTPGPVPARPRRAGQSPSNPSGEGHTGGAATPALRRAESGSEGEHNGTFTCWDAVAAAHVKPRQPFARPVGLALPEWGKDVPAKIFVDFDADATTSHDAADELKRLANLCEVLIQTGILSPLDWASALDLSVTAALSQFIDEKMGCGDLRRLNFVSLRWTTDLENGSCHDESGNAEALAWQQAFAPDMAAGKPIGGFTLRGDGTMFEPVSLELWGKHLKSALGKETAADCIGVLVQMVSYLGGWTPAWAYDKAAEEVDSYEEIADENDDDPGYDTHERNAKESFAWFKEVIPDYALSYEFDIPRMEKAAAQAKHKKMPCAPMVEASLRCARYMEIIRDNNPFSANSLCHLGSGYGQGYPPVLVFWANEVDAANDPCVRIYDDWGEFAMEQGSDLIWLHGWDDEKPGDAKTPGTIRRAVYALALTLGLVALLDKLIEMWESAVPTTRAQPLVQIFAHEDAARTAGDVLQIAEGMLSQCK